MYAESSSPLIPRSSLPGSDKLHRYNSKDDWRHAIGDRWWLWGIGQDDCGTSGLSWRDKFEEECAKGVVGPPSKHPNTCRSCLSMSSKDTLSAHKCILQDLQSSAVSYLLYRIPMSRRPWVWVYTPQMGIRNVIPSGDESAQRASRTIVNVQNF